MRESFIYPFVPILQRLDKNRIGAGRLPEEMATKIIDVGDRLMIKGDSHAEVDRLLQDHVAQGAKVITATVAIGRRWIAACTVPGQAPVAPKVIRRPRSP